MLRALDLALLRVLRSHGHAPPVELAVRAFSRAGEHGLLWHGICLVGLALDPRRRDLYRGAMRTVLLAYLANIALKYVIRRARPILPELPALATTVTTLSYPSAHATTSFAAARTLSRELPAGPPYAAATAMALSRPYLGVHFPSDVVAGAFFGSAIAELLGP